MQGKVVRLMKDKKFGFIAANDKDYFFHKADLRDSWDQLVDDYENHEQILVEFDGVKNPKGLRAVSVERVYD